MNRRSFFRRALGFIGLCAVAPTVVVRKPAKVTIGTTAYNFSSWVYMQPVNCSNWVYMQPAKIRITKPVAHMLEGCYTATVTFVGPFDA